MSNFYGSDLDEFDIEDDEDDIFGLSENITKKTSVKDTNISSDINKNVDSKVSFNTHPDSKLGTNERTNTVKSDLLNINKKDKMLDIFPDNSKTTLPDSSKKASILTELFGGSSLKSKIQSTSSETTIFGSLKTGKSSSLENILNTSVSDSYVPDLENRKRIGRRNSQKTVNDPLGFFSKTEPVLDRSSSLAQDKNEGVETVKTDDKLPSWLSGSDSKTTSKDSTEKTVEFKDLKDTNLQNKNITESNVKKSKEDITEIYSEENENVQKELSKPTVTFKKSQIHDNTNEVYSKLNEKLFELEKKYSEDIIECMKLNHNKELTILEESYRKQLLLLEETLTSTEQRLKSDVDATVQFYNSKIEQLHTEIDSKDTYYQQKINTLVQQYQNELQDQEDKHKKLIENLERDYIITTENIRRSKQIEDKIINEAESYSKLLNDALAELKSNSESVLSLKDTLREQILNEISKKEIEFKNREADLTSQKNNLLKEKEYIDLERNKLSSLLTSFESHIKDQTNSVKETQSELKTQSERLSLREKALDFEIERNKDIAQREISQIEMMREMLIKEHERQLMILTEEKTTLAMEKAKQNTMVKLNRDMDNYKSNVEVDAAVNAAKEVSRAVHEEREALLSEQRKLISEKVNLETRERAVQLKEQEIIEMFQACEQKKYESEQIMREAKLIQQKYSEQYKSLQLQISTLRMREKKLMEDKLILSKDKIAFHKSQTCALCAVKDVSSEEQLNPSTVEINMAEHGPSSLLRNSLDVELASLKNDIYGVLHKNL